MSELEQNLSTNALMLVVETLAAKELYDSTRTTEDFEFFCEKLKALESYIAELEAKNERYIKLIQDWVDVFDPRYPQGDSLASAVRLAMIESIDETPEVQE